MKQISSFFSQVSQGFVALLLADLLVLVLHLLFSGHSTFFHLDFEQNLPTIYQSGKLLFFGILFLLSTTTKKSCFELRSFIVPLSVFMIALGIDELFQVHENIYRVFEHVNWLHPSRIVDISMGLGYKSSLWILYYLPVIFLFVFWSGYWLRYFQSKFTSNYLIALLSAVSMFIIILSEVLSSTGSFSDQAYFWMITIEETAEMLLASSLAIVGSKMLERQKDNP